MTREQIGAEKVALQKALLYYESIHGRPVRPGASLPACITTILCMDRCFSPTMKDHLSAYCAEKLTYIDISCMH